MEGPSPHPRGHFPRESKGEGNCPGNDGNLLQCPLGNQGHFGFGYPKWVDGPQRKAGVGVLQGTMANELPKPHLSPGWTLLSLLGPGHGPCLCS